MHINFRWVYFQRTKSSPQVTSLDSSCKISCLLVMKNFRKAFEIEGLTSQQQKVGSVELRKEQNITQCLQKSFRSKLRLTLLLKLL